MTKREIIDQIEAAVCERNRLNNKPVNPYPESFKKALENESEKTLLSDLKLVKKQLAEVHKRSDDSSKSVI